MHVSDHREVEPAPDHGAVEERHERPEDWGWHADLSGVARGAGIVSCIVILLMLTSNDIGNIGKVWAIIIVIGMVLGILWDRHRSKNRWRRS